MPAIATCLWFDTQGEEAAEFYVSLFPNSEVKEVTRYGPDVPEREGKAMLVTFTLDGREYQALNGGPQFTFSEAVSIFVHCQDQAEVDHYWNGLLAGGGEESMCGWLKDRYGVSWQICPDELLALTTDPDPARASRALQAMYKMRKIDIAALRAATNAG